MRGAIGASLTVLLLASAGLAPAADAAATSILDGQPSTRDDGSTIPAGFDLFETDPQQTHFDFSGPTAIPPDFFGPGSQPFTGQVKFCGVPLEQFENKDVGDADTVVQRTQAMTFGPGTSATVPIELVSLNLVSCQPITVQFSGKTQDWDVRVAPSQTAPSQGNMTVNHTATNGGTFDSQLNVLPIFTFKGSGGTTRVLDLGAAGSGVTGGLQFQSTGTPWRAGCVLPALAVPGLNDGFCPGLTTGGIKQVSVEKSVLATHGVVPAQPRLEHFACYQTRQQGRFKQRSVKLTDQFGTLAAKVLKPRLLCNPAQKNNEPFVQKKVHLKCYAIKPVAVKKRTAVTRDQFGSLTLSVLKRESLCTPAFKALVKGGRVPALSGPPNPKLVDNFLCYQVRQQGTFGRQQVTIKDQFGRAKLVIVKPVTLCNPAQVNQTPSYHPVGHLICYVITGPAARTRQAVARNSFGTERLRISARQRLCVPGDKVLPPDG